MSTALNEDHAAVLYSRIPDSMSTYLESLFSMEFVWNGLNEVSAFEEVHRFVFKTRLHMHGVSTQAITLVHISSSPYNGTPFYSELLQAARYMLPSRNICNLVYIDDMQRYIV